MRFTSKFVQKLIPICDYSAFYGRIEDGLSQLPSQYRHIKPHIAFGSPYKRNTHSDEASPYSINWIVCDPAHAYEKIVSKLGLISKASEESPSRISKMELMKRFVDVMQHLPDFAAHTTFDATQTYEKMKADAIDYNSAKEAFIKAFQAKNLGDWCKVQKPTEIDKFRM